MRFILALLLLLPFATHAQEAVKTFGSGPQMFRLRSTTDIDILGPVIERFAELNPGITVEFEQWGSNALFENSRAACEGGDDPADVVFSSAVQQMVWLVNSSCAQPYTSALTAALPDTRRWRNELWGITQEPAVIVYNRDQIIGADVPRTRFALLDLMRTRPADLRGRIATYDITESGLGFLFAHSDSLEASTFGAMLEGFSRVGAVATCCSAEIIDGVASGRFQIAYNVLGSYAASNERPNVGIITPEDYTLILSRGFMIPNNARQPQIAERLLDFLLDEEAQQMLADVGLRMSHAPEETGMPVSARRPIALSPTLLIAMDQGQRRQLFALWSNAFEPDVP